MNSCRKIRDFHDATACLLSIRTDWATPPELFAELDKEFGFTLDVCARVDNTKCERFFSPEDDGLSQLWAPERCWMNPPYGRGMKRWIEKAYRESSRGALVVALVPARTDTAWFHDYTQGKAELRFLRGRVRFVGAEHNAPFPSMLCIWRPEA